MVAPREPHLQAGIRHWLGFANVKKEDMCSIVVKNHVVVNERLSVFQQFCETGFFSLQVHNFFLPLPYLAKWTFPFP